MADAGGAVIGALRVVLGADTANFDKGLKDAQGGMSSFVKSMTSVAAGVGLEKMLEGFVNSAVNAVKHGIQLGDQLNKMSQSAGISVEELSKLKYAAELSDVPVEALGKSMGKLSKFLVSAATDGAGQAARAFSMMGISVKDANDNIRPTSDIFADIADKFSGYKDGAEKTALAIAIFGKAGAALIPLLNQGRQGLKEAGDEAQQFGLVLDKQTTIAAETFMDNLKKLDAIKQGLYVTIARDLLPSLLSLSQAWLDNKKNSDFTANASEVVTGVIRVLGSEITLLIEKLRGAGRELIAFKDFLSQVGDINDLRTSWNRWGLVVSDNEEKLAGLKMTLASLKDAMDPTSFVSRFTIMTGAIASATAETKRLQEEAKKVTAPGVGDVTAQKNALDKFIESQAKRTAGMQADAETVGKSAADQAYLKIVYEAQAIALNNNIPLTAALNAQITLAGQNAAAAANQIAAANVAQQVRSPAQKFADDLKELQVMYETTSMTAETFALRQKQLADGVGATWNAAGAGMAGGFAQLATQFGKSSKEMATAAKVFGIIEATINTYTAFTKALASAPPPFNYIMAAGVLAAGMAKVMAIKSQSVGGFKTGGSFMVGGSGGTDSQNVGFKATPGERVDVWRPGQGADPRMAVSQPNTVKVIELRGMEGRNIWTMDNVKEVIEAINDAAGYGYKIKVVH